MLESVVKYSSHVLFVSYTFTSFSHNKPGVQRAQVCDTSVFRMCAKGVRSEPCKLVVAVAQLGRKPIQSGKDAYQTG